MSRLFTPCTLALICSCASLEPGPAGDCQLCDLWGSDSREEAYEAKALHLRRAARATGAIFTADAYAERVEIDNFEENFPYSYTLGEILEDEFQGIDVCPEVRFLSQPSRVAECAAVLVTPTKMVSAAHCFDPRFSVYDTAEEMCSRTMVVFDYVHEERELHSNPGPAITAESFYRCTSVQTFAHLSGEVIYPDLAVIELDRRVEDRSPLELQRGVRPAPNSTVASFGFPEGLPMKLSRGVVKETLLTDQYQTLLQQSNPTRLREERRNYAMYADVIPLKMSSSPGNSGGPLVDLSTGELFGIIAMASPKIILDAAGGQDFELQWRERTNDSFYVDDFNRETPCIAAYDCTRPETVCQTHTGAMSTKSLPDIL